MFVKVCGLKTLEQIDAAVDIGYDAVGIVLYPKSKRYCPPEMARELAAYAQGKVETFVVSKTYAEVTEVADAFDVVQIYEQQPLPNLAFSSRERPPAGLSCRYFFYDPSAGSGTFQAFPDWLKGIHPKLVLAGGLNPENVAEVIRPLTPFGVDVSSGVEQDGVKDLDLMQAFVQNARNAL